MAKKRWSLSVPMEGFDMRELGDVAREAERLGYTDAWSFEVDGVDCFTPLAVIGVATDMRLGTAIANVYTRGPATLASMAAGLADLAPGRFVLGIGSGSQPIVEAWNGGRFALPGSPPAYPCPTDRASMIPTNAPIRPAAPPPQHTERTRPEDPAKARALPLLTVWRSVSTRSRA